MFGGSRRRRPPTTPLNSTTANPNATTAAASAFMSAANQNPNRALSSAAAAAALRARPHTPTNVAEVRTKRTVRRSASASSSSSAPGGVRLANGLSPLERRGSTASMTERTFRSPSPRRMSTPATHRQQPPVPEIPDSHKNSAANSRAAGVGMQNFRTASQKMETVHSSWHLQPAGDTSNVRTSDAAMRSTKSPPPSLPNIVTSQSSRPDSRSSVNFSYPTTFRQQSPPTSPITSSVSHSKVASPHPPESMSSSRAGPPSSTDVQSNQQLIYDPNSRRMVPKARIEEVVELRIKQAVEKPQRRRRDGAHRREGGQLAKGTVARSKGTIVDGNKNLDELSRREEPMLGVSMPAEETPLEEEEPKTQTATANRVLNPNKSTLSPEPRGSGLQSPPPSAYKTSNEQGIESQPSHSIQNFPATVQDEAISNDEQSSIGSHPYPPQTVLDVLDAIPTRQTLFKPPQASQPGQKLDDREIEIPQDSRSLRTIEGSGLAEASSEQKPAVAENKPVAVLAEESSGLRRSSSNSPARQARFAPGPAEKLAVRHAPLPRSASPIKSAMKHSGPMTRETSPSDNVSNPSVSGAISPDQKEESAIARRKSVRVSFDDHGTVIVGDSTPTIEAESSTSQSPQGPKRSWFSNIGRSKRKEVTLEDDEIMKPRPALPSFGSVRDKKMREPEERSLVRPLESAYSPAISSSSPDLRPQSSSTLNDSETTEEPSLGQSNDHAIGALLAQDQTYRNVANISRFREPLPPVVTSAEGFGYSSDSSHDSDNGDPPDSTIDPDVSTMDSSVLSTQLTHPGKDRNLEDEPTAIGIPQGQQVEFPQSSVQQPQEIPKISVIQPSPRHLEQCPCPTGESSYFDVPGGFPNGESDLNSGGPLETTKDGTMTKNLPSNAAIFEPTTAHVEPGQAKVLPKTTLDTTTPLTGVDNTTGDESDESIYSDAYEDIPDLDTSGFISLDAIVESPTNEQSSPPSHQASESLRGAAPREPTRETISGDSLVQQAQATRSQDINEWEQAKAFWRSLTAEKRRQLELEAIEEAGAEGDREEISQPIRRSSTRKKSPELAQPATQILPTQGKPTEPELPVRKSLRVEQATKPTSSQPQMSMRKTLRANGAAQSVAKPSTQQAATTPTPVSMPIASGRRKTTKPRPHSSSLLVAKSPTDAQSKPPLERRGSDASDSSFKRSRPPPSGASAFRKTMRQTSASQPRHESTRGSGRFSLRSLSPVGSTVRHDPTIGGMRRTLRSNSESSHEGKRSSIHFPIFTRSTKSSPKSSKWASRFEDSSDEDVGSLTGFQSRIDDSSDEDTRRPSSSRTSKSLGKAAFRGSATVPSLSRPAPVPELEEDSPELPDSDDDFMPGLLQNTRNGATQGDFSSRLGAGHSSSRAIGTSTLGRSRFGRGGPPPLLTSPASPTKDPRGSLFSILRRNKRADQTGKIQRSEPVESAARRDTKLERDLKQLKDLRGDQPSSPKLQKKTSMIRSDSGGLQRPTSAGNLFSRSGTAKGPSLGNRRSYSLGLNPNNDMHEFENASIDSSGLPKKKKFGALRRMFKLDE
ncbi:hypothetical protein GGS24DRAFT_245372 [Hypoxylon argillaceum]|nr:hypothetical protein GGS24DRAFT_245372 [Hypoxylon argillaceum]